MIQIQAFQGQIPSESIPWSPTDATFVYKSHGKRSVQLRPVGFQGEGGVAHEAARVGMGPMNSFPEIFEQRGP